MQPKKIAEISINIVNDCPTPQEQFVEDYNHCPLCGSEMDFTHVTDFAVGLVQENAECTPCSIKVKSNQHKLQ